MPGRFANLNFEPPFVIQNGNTRSLHFTLGEVQSSMCLERPDELQVDYTRTMMGFLLLDAKPRRIGLIGLGGGSLVKFCHRRLPWAHMTVVENNPAVIALRREFEVPEDDARLSVVTGEGAAYVATVRAAFDVLLVDGFDQDGQPPQLASHAFYQDCFEALASEGVLVLNLHADHPEHSLFLSRLAACCAGNALQVLAGEMANCIVLASRGRPVTLEAVRGADWARWLDSAAQGQLRDEFARIAWSASAVHASGRATA